MTPERWRQIESLYQSARTAPGAAERERILAAADPDIRREVEELLAGNPAEQTITQPLNAGITPGVRIGVHRIEAKIGEGGMGQVYRAIDTRLNRAVAIKFLPDDLADAAARRRFQTEAQTASCLNHPHIVTVHDVGEHEGRQYLVTEYVDGGTLKQWADQEPRTWRDVVDLLTGVADGLATAHDAKILHRDIKPGNILISKNGYAKLADFGLAKLIQGSEDTATRTIGESLTKQGMIIGTIPYMSPEQASGQQLDCRSDIFSFGIVVYEMLAGKRPFAGATELELLKTIVHADPLPLPDAIPAPLRGIVAKCLKKSPAERYESMRDMVTDLRHLTREPAQPPATTKRQAWMVPAGIAAAIALGAGLWFSLRPAAELPNPLAGAKFMRLTDFPGDETQAVISPDGKTLLFGSDREKPRGLFVTHIGSGEYMNLTKGLSGYDPNTRFSAAGGFNGDATKAWIPGPPPPSNRMRLIPLTGGAPVPFLYSNTATVNWSPDGKRIVYFNNPRGVGDPTFVADIDGSNARQIMVDVEGVHNHFPTWSAEGLWIYFVHGDVAAMEMDLWRISPNGGAREQLTRHNGYVGFPAPLDERTVLYIAEDADGSGPWLWALDVETKTTRRVTSGIERYMSISASAPVRGRPRRLVAAVSNPVASLWSVPILDSVAEERDAKPYPVGNARALMPRFGGTSLFFLSSQGGDDALWRWENDKATEVWKNPTVALREAPAISSDGKLAAVLIRQGAKRRLWVVGTDGSQPHAVAETIDVTGSVGWSHDAEWIAAGGNDGSGLGLFKIPVKSGPPVRLTSGTARNAVWSPDNSLIVFAGTNSGGGEPVQAVTPEGQLVELPPIRSSAGGERFRFLPNGKGLIYMDSGGAFQGQNFYLFDLATKTTRRLTKLDDSMTMRTFDISPDGKQIIFDRMRENSDIIAIDLPAK